MFFGHSRTHLSGLTQDHLDVVRGSLVHLQGAPGSPIAPQYAVSWNTPAGYQSRPGRCPENLLLEAAGLFVLVILAFVITGVGLHVRIRVGSRTTTLAAAYR